MFQTPVIVSGVRTATGKFGGALKDIEAPALGALCTKEALKRANITGDMVDEVIIGTHFQAGIKANSARQVSLGAGIPVEVPAWTVNKNCGTGLKAIQSAAEHIMLGEADIMVAGGCESMSRIPYVLKDYRFGGRMGSGQVLDSMLYDGLVDPFMNYHMGITAENVAEKCGITREMQDEFALLSHKRAQEAAEAGKFDEEIIPVEVKTKKGTVIFDKDETIRYNAKIEDFRKLKPAFRPDGGTVTAGNASGCNDEAAIVVMMSERKAKELGLEIKAALRGFASAGIHPSIMGYAPVYAVQKLLKKVNMTVDDIDLFEINEAFAAQAFACVRDLGLSMDIVNVNGGAIALGHPVGATGARLTINMMNELRRRNCRYGVVTLCIGGGQAIAALVENVAGGAKE